MKNFWKLFVWCIVYSSCLVPSFHPVLCTYRKARNKFENVVLFLARPILNLLLIFIFWCFSEKASQTRSLFFVFVGHSHLDRIAMMSLETTWNYVWKLLKYQITLKYHHFLDWSIDSFKRIWWLVSIIPVMIRLEARSMNMRNALILSLTNSHLFAAASKRVCVIWIEW